MANFAGEVYGQAGSVWKKLSAGQKIMIGLTAAALLAGIAGVVYWSSRLEMGLLFGSLSPEDAGKVQAKLDEESVPYELRAGGSVYVPRDRIHELRARLAMEGLPRGDLQGMELFDTAQMGMTDFMQNVNLTRAKEGELARAITWLDQVAAARVFITRPKPTIFSEMERDPTAAVIVRLVPGMNLSQREVAGIAHIVSCAVEGLRCENVKITDASGRLLSRPPEDEAEQLGGTQLDLKHAFEKALVTKVQSQLDEVMGANKVRVVCNVDLDSNRKSEKKKTYDAPEGGKLYKKETIDTEDSSTTHASGGGSTSTQDKVANQGSAPVTGDKTTNEKIEREYLTNETETEIVQGGLTVKRMSLAIMVDKTLEKSRRTSSRS